MTRREKELTEILLFIAEGLLSKALVIDNERIHKIPTDPAAVLRAAADEVRMAVGCNIRHEPKHGQAAVSAEIIEIMINGQLKQFGPWVQGDRMKAVGTVMVDVNQIEEQLHCPRTNEVIARRAGDTQVKLTISARPESEIIPEMMKNGLH